MMIKKYREPKRDFKASRGFDRGEPSGFRVRHWVGVYLRQQLRQTADRGDLGRGLA